MIYPSQTLYKRDTHGKIREWTVEYAGPVGAGIRTIAGIKDGKLVTSGWKSTEGKNFGKAKIDDAYSINDNDALSVLFELLEKEGLSLGTSSGINVAGAIKLGKDLGSNHTIVTILCDTADKYRSKLSNKKFLVDKGLPYPKWL